MAQPIFVAVAVSQAGDAWGCSSEVGQRRSATWPMRPLLPKESETRMSFIVSFFAVLNRPSVDGPATQTKAHTTAEEMMGLL
ncbi:hypothetical protein [Intrasporangium sp.]|uniref:hypothetical protein n=1 Tax=Intrasporangium sp. TaxID=1925024 RepID=UPI003222075A